MGGGGGEVLGSWQGAGGWGGGGVGVMAGGRVPPWHFSPGNFCRLTRKWEARKNGKKQKGRKIWKGKEGNYKWKGGKVWAEDFLVFFFFLRVRAVFHKTVRVCHVYCNFKIGFTCRITIIFGTLKDGSLLINTLASNICFSYRNMFQNGVDALSKIVDAFLSKSSKFYLVRIIR